MRDENIADVYKLTPVQQGMLFHTLYAPESAVYFDQFSYRIANAVDISAFQQAWQQALDRHPILRTAFFWEGLDEPLQMVSRQVALPLERLDWRDRSESEQQAQLAALLKQDRQRGFDLSVAPLMRLTLIQLDANTYQFIWRYHHLLLDGWSVVLLLGEVFSSYEARVRGDTLQIAPSRPYKDYVVWLRRQDLTQAEAFWRRTLHGFTMPTPLGDGAQPLGVDGDAPEIEQQQIQLTPATTAQLHALARGLHLTLNTLVQAAWALLLARWSGAQEVVFGSTVSGRPPSLAGVETMLGLFINTLPVRVQVPATGSLSGWLKGVHMQQMALREFEYSPLVQVQGWSDVPRSLPLFESILVFENYPNHPAADMEVGWSFQKTNYPLTVVAKPGAALHLAIGYDGRRFEQATVARMLGHMQTLLAGMAQQPQRLSELSLLTAAERAQLLVEWNATSAPLPSVIGLPALFAAQAARTPDAIALVYETKDERRRTKAVGAQYIVPLQLSATQLSYRELNRRANQLAHHLRGLGVRSETRIALALDRSPELLIGLLGVLKAGAAYVPLDPSYPPQRLAFMLDDSRATLLLTNDERRTTNDEALNPSSVLRPSSFVKTVDLFSDWPLIAGESIDDLPAGSLAEQLAYVIYTSGSTGAPKGVMVTHGALHNLLASMQRAPGLCAADTLLALTTVAFDIAGLELFLPLTVGARLVLASEDVGRDGAQLAQTLRQQAVTVLQATPATWRLLLAAGWRGQPGLRALCGGEALPATLASALRPQVAELWNMYGPTETTIWSTTMALGATARVPIGRPIANTQAYVLDAHMQPVALGVVGELYLGGAGLARGYLARADLTAERFVPNPFAALTPAAAAAPPLPRTGEGAGGEGTRLYRTGDRVRYQRDGQLVYLGRADAQVKLRGYRIELGEIEAALRRHAGVREAVVRLLAREEAEPQLVAYVVPDRRDAISCVSTTNDDYTDTISTDAIFCVSTGDDHADSSIVQELREQLGQTLPRYMRPAAFVLLDALPLTPNGKIDRNALDKLGTQPGVRKGYVAPRSAFEQSIAAIWRVVLNVEQIDVNDNFFDIGGHSLLITKVYNKIREALGINIPIRDLFNYPTISALARYLAADQAEQPAQQAGQLRAELRKGQTARADTAIAIIGMAGRFPGADNLATFWQNLADGVESITFFSDQELAAVGIDSAALHQPHYVKARPMLNGIEQFDAAFFGFTPREAELTDPQHRLFLECAWTALEDAGYSPGGYQGAIGVYAGAGMNTYLFSNLYTNYQLLEAAGSHPTMIGNDKDFLATRVSYKLNLRGPSLTVQTACSTALVAVHLACQSLLNGESDLALAGGVSVNVPQISGYWHEPGGLASPDGHCRPFDAQAQGTVFGNGVGAVVLKRLADALADGDSIAAVIKGSAINNDGAGKVGYTAPSEAGQVAVIAEALAIAGVDPATIGYVEGHGTGTPLGDPIEVAALTKAYRATTDRSGVCALGSVKANLGHLDAAAGIAGLIKTVLALRAQTLPPSPYFQSPNPQIDFGPFYVATERAPWPAAPSVPRRAGISSFGIGGTNAHVILEEAPPLPMSTPAPDWQLLPLAAKTPAALDALTAQLQAYLAQSPTANLADVAYTLQVGRQHFAQRRCWVVRDRDDARAALADRSRARNTSNISANPTVVFLFPGQGAQSPQMAAQLYQSEPIFRAAVDRCAELLVPHLGRDIREMLYPRDEGRRTKDEGSDSSFVLRPSSDIAGSLDQTWLAQPALFVVAYALAQCWLAWGVQPAALLGHSLGEYVAASIAGVFSLDDALMLVATRGRLMQALPSGAMLAVAASEEQLAPLLGTLALAAINGPQRCVVSGPHAAVAALAARLAAQTIETRMLHTSHAFHSPMLDPMLAPFRDAVQRVRLQPPQIPYVSNVSGTWITAAQATDPDYWVTQVRAPVRFDAALTTLAALEPLLLEVGPGQTLTRLARQHPATAARPAYATLPHPQDPQPERAALLGTLGQLWLAGVAIDWAKLASSPRRRLALPTYPFERQRYWIDPQPMTAPARADARQSNERRPLDDWFYQPIWTPTPLAHIRADAAPQTWLVLLDECDLGAGVVARLAAGGHTVCTVRAGATFAACGAQDYTLDPKQPADYAQLLSALQAQDQLPQTILHLWGVTSHTDAWDDLATVAAQQARGFDSLLALAQALGNVAAEAAMRLVVVTTQQQAIMGEAALCPAKALALGACRVIPQEYPAITCQSIDINWPARHPRQHDARISQLLAELGASTLDRAIAYRGRERLVQSFAPVALATGAPTRLRSNGIYLITGGLGGIGRTLAAYLAETVQARLVLVGRTALPARADWDTWLSDHGDDDPTSVKIRAVVALEAQGAQVLLAAADVTDPVALRAVVDQTLARFGALHGVIHAAGVAGGGVIALKTPAQVAAVLAPKVQGTLALWASVRDQPLDFCVLCSSITAIAGGVGQVDYCAANAFLDAFARHCAAHENAPVVAINWDRWQEIGMAVDADTSKRDRLRKIAHPLLDTCLIDTPSQKIYLTEFSIKNWVLSEHTVAGIAVVPGTTYVEMAIAALAEEDPAASLELRELLFTKPLALQADETRPVLTILEQEGATFNFKIMSRPEDQYWQTHATGKISRVETAQPLQLDLAHIKRRCNILKDSATSTRDADDAFLVTGPRWRSIQAIYAGADEGLACLALPEGYLDDLKRYSMHPALLDVATGSVQFLGSGNYLPLMYERIVIKAPLTSKIYSHITYNPTNNTRDVIRCDVTIMDERGVELVSVNGFAMKLVTNQMIKPLNGVSSNGVENNTNTAQLESFYNKLVAKSHEPEHIRPAEGVAVFERVLANDGLSQVIASTHDLHELLKTLNTFVEPEADAPIPAQFRHPRPQLPLPYVAPDSDLERSIAAIWQSVLGIDQVGRHDNFFELGGDSLIAIRIMSALKKDLSLNVSALSLFEAPTIQSLALLLVQGETSFQHSRDRAEKKHSVIDRKRQLSARRRA